MALFFLNGEKQLIPIAIQLYQDIEPNNPVSTSQVPNTGEVVYQENFLIKVFKQNKEWKKWLKFEMDFHI